MIILKTPPEIRDIHKNIILCCYIMYMNIISFMNVIDTTIRYQSTEPLSNLQAEKLHQGLDARIFIYNHDGHTVTEIRRDKQFATTMGTVKNDLGMHMNYTAAKYHEPVAQHNILTVKDCIRTIFHSLPFIMTPKLMVSKLTTIATNRLNWFSVNVIISHYYISNIIIHWILLDYENHY